MVALPTSFLRHLCSTLTPWQSCYAPKRTLERTAIAPAPLVNVAAVHPALDLEEIVHHIILFLRDDRATLMACSRVSNRFHFSCQRIIFSDLHLNACQVCDFVSVLSASPHLWSFVRHLDVSLEASPAREWEKMVEAMTSSSPYLTHVVSLDIRGGHYVGKATGTQLLPALLSALVVLWSHRAIQRLSIHHVPSTLMCYLSSRAGSCLSRLVSLSISMEDGEEMGDYVNHILAQAPCLREIRYSAVESSHSDIDPNPKFTLDLSKNTMLASLSIETPRLSCFSVAQLDLVIRCLRSHGSGTLETAEFAFTGQRETTALEALDEVLGNSELLPLLRSVTVCWDIAEYDQKEWFLNRKGEWVVDTRSALHRFSLTRERGVHVAVVSRW
ncbi:hypothetical protein FISHEDRAFT_54908 [Fistulina hepatica ATCC 64428]|uniref:F-box domain-containing protein n=1 Tax=Fistulina hepatica ATCC 64428 TaxID=1128425 RepID=A0A0D7AQA9_9AGAR|nr:hypothetical protein FISHEDRAFT_54908 [Fistulina hepatica ATCC 64428]